MKRISLFLASFFTLVSCNDGDIIIAQLEFDSAFSECGNKVFYKTKTNPNESLSLQITSPVFNFEDYFNKENIDPKTSTYSKNYIINGSTNRFNYRTYNIDPNGLFCNDVPPSNTGVIKDSSSPTGIATITGELIFDDNDGIPTEIEKKQAIDKDGNPMVDEKGNPIYVDTDGDGLADYIDADDDGDNVFTADEKVSYDEKTKELKAEDTDGDGIPDYLDTDDDGDGVATRDEENDTADQNPTNDYTGTNSSVADYLNDTIKTTVPATAYRSNTYQEKIELKINVTKLTLQDLRQDSFDFGTLATPPIKSITITPQF